MDKNETMYKKIQKLEQASRDLKEAHDYTEVLLKGFLKYHEAARHTWSDIPRPQEDTSYLRGTSDCFGYFSFALP